MCIRDSLGWYLDDGKAKTIKVPGIDLTNAISASFNFDVMLAMGQTIEYSFNGKPAHSFTVPTRDGSSAQTSLRGFTLDAPLSELVSGDNTITLKALAPNFVEGIGNVDITVEAPQ